MRILAQKDYWQEVKPLQGMGRLGLEGVGPNGAGGVLVETLSKIIGFMTLVAGLWFIFQIIIAGYSWLSAGGDAQSLQKAQAKLWQAVVGLTIVVVALFLVSLVGWMLGIDFLKIEQLWGG